MEAHDRSSAAIPDYDQSPLFIKVESGYVRPGGKQGRAKGSNMKTLPSCNFTSFLTLIYKKKKKDMRELTNGSKPVSSPSCHGKSQSSICKKNRKCNIKLQKPIDAALHELSKKSGQSCDFLSFDSEETRRFKSAVMLSKPVDQARVALSIQSERCGHWRRIAVNTIIQLVHAYGVKDETAAHAIALLDRFLAAHLASSEASLIGDKAECYAMSCFLVATKFKDISAPCVSDMVRITRLPWSDEEIVRCEADVLNSIDWALHATTGDDYVPRPPQTA